MITARTGLSVTGARTRQPGQQRNSGRGGGQRSAEDQGFGRQVRSGGGEGQGLWIGGFYRPLAGPGFSGADLPARRDAEELKSSGLKATLPRIKILEVFQNAPRRHMTAEDVYKALLTDGADIGLATVYRVLMQFEQAGLLTRSTSSPARRCSN